MKNTLIRVIAACLVLISVSAWSASTKDEVMEVQDQLEEIQKELAEIKQLLKEGARAGAAEPAFKEQSIALGSSPVKGNPDAPVTLVEYSDYQCPFCARHYRDTMPILQEEYIDTGKLKFVMREYPLPQLHKNATRAAMSAQCAHQQGKYWEMHNIMFDNQRELADENLKAYAATIGLDTAAFDACMDNKDTIKAVRADLASGQALGMGGTPGFFLGLTDPTDSGRATMSVQIKGAQPVDNFKAAIDRLLDSIE